MLHYVIWNNKQFNQASYWWQKMAWPCQHKVLLHCMIDDYLPLFRKQSDLFWKWIHLSLAYRIVIVLYEELFNLSLIRDKEIRERYFRFICFHIPFQYDTRLLWLTSFLSFFYYLYWLWHHCWVLLRGVYQGYSTPMTFKQIHIRDYNTTFNSKTLMQWVCW